MRRRTFIQSAVLIPIVLRTYKNDQYAQKTTMDMNTGYEGPTSGTRTSMDYKAIAEMAKGFREGRDEGKSPLDHIERIAGLKGVEVKHLGYSRYKAIKIKWGEGRRKLSCVHNFLGSRKNPGESSTILPWVESLRISEQVFDPHAVSYVTFFMDRLEWVPKLACEIIEQETGDSQSRVVLLKGEGQHRDGLRLRSASLTPYKDIGVDSEGRQCYVYDDHSSQGKLLREIERMASQTSTLLHDFTTGGAFDPRHGPCHVYESSISSIGSIYHSTEKREISVFRGSKVFVGGISPFDTDTELGLGGELLERLAYTNKTHLSARTEVPKSWDLKKRELVHTLTDIAVLNVEL